MKSFTWGEVCAWRLARGCLAKPAHGDKIPQVLSKVCGVQAQILSAAELALSARLEGITQQAVEDELWDYRRIVKTIGPRQTLHLLPTAELSMWMAAMRARHALYESHWYEKDGLQPAEANALLAAIGECLDGRSLTREQLAAEVSLLAGAWTKEKLESPWGNLLGPAAFTGLLCFGPSQGNKVTFVRADQWIGNEWQEVDTDEALKEACRRYLTAYGPAGYQGFAHWFGLKPLDARRVMEGLASELVEVAVEGKRYWMLTKDAEENWVVEKPSIHLLPQYDCYLLGCGERERVVPQAARKRVSTYKRGRFEGATGVPVLLVDGMVGGIWEREARGKRVNLRVEPFIDLAADQRQELESEANRVGAFLGAEVSLSIEALQ